MLEITSEDQFHEETKEGVVVVDIYATWCGPCKMIAPIISELDKEYADVKFLSVDADKNKDITEELGVMSIPTILTIVDGKVTEKFTGYRPKPVIEEQVKNGIKNLGATSAQ